jgi:hypothetical protein
MASKPVLASKQMFGASAQRARAVVPDESVATTLLLDPAVRHGLTLIRRTTGATMNKLVNEAVALYVADRVKTIEFDLQAALDRVRQYHATDPTYAAQARLIAAEEAAQTRSDPVEGRMVAAHRAAPRRAAARGRQPLAQTQPLKSSLCSCIGTRTARSLATANGNCGASTLRQPGRTRTTRRDHPPP